MVLVGILEFAGMVVGLYNTCFTGDTLVATEDGRRRIDQIKVGDKVWAYNPDTGEKELKEVVNVFVKETDEILHLKTTDGDIDTTTTHPFYVVGQGWTAAGDLNAGDEIYALDGSAVTILSTSLEKLDEPIKVYNLEVADFHTYFVGNTGMLVHNRCGGSGSKETGSSDRKGWHTGDPIDKPTYRGTNPSWTTSRHRYWKNEAYYNGSGYSPENLERMKRGRAPRRYNRRTGKWESMELHHLDPQRNGGAHSYDNLERLWPEEHAEKDKYRYIGGR